MNAPKSYIGGWIIIFCIIIYATVWICKDNIVANGWMVLAKEKKSIAESVLTLICASAIPLFRVLMVATIIWISATNIDDTPLAPDNT